MSKLPKFLPKMLCINGDWEKKILPKLYSIFEWDFKRSIPIYDGKRVYHDSRILKDEGMEKGFWHIITKGDGKNRSIDYNRAKRLNWIKPIIEHHFHQSIKVWDYKESNKKIRTYLWLEEYDFVVILQQERNNCLLITSFCVEYPNTRRKFERKYENRIK